VGPPFSRTSVEVVGREGVEATAGEAELFGGLRGADRTLPKGVEHVADELGGVAMEELLMLFKTHRIAAGLGHTTSLFVGHRYARPPQRLMVWPRRFLFC